MRSGSTLRLRTAISTERSSLSRSNGTFRPDFLTTTRITQLHPLESGEAGRRNRGRRVAFGSPRRPSAGGNPSPAYLPTGNKGQRMEKPLVGESGEAKGLEVFATMAN